MKILDNLWDWLLEDGPLSDTVGPYIFIIIFVLSIIGFINLVGLALLG